MVKYDKLWKLLKISQLKKCDLQKMICASPSTMAKLGKNEIISMQILVKICVALKCDIGDIMEVVIE